MMKGGRSFVLVEGVKEPSPGLGPISLVNISREYINTSNFEFQLCFLVHFLSVGCSVVLAGPEHVLHIPLFVDCIRFILIYIIPSVSLKTASLSRE